MMQFIDSYNNNKSSISFANDFQYSVVTGLYYVTEFNSGRMVVFDSNWIYQFYIELTTSSRYFLVIGNEIFYVGDVNISLNKFKIYSNGEILKNFSFESFQVKSDFQPKGLIYDEENDMIVVASKSNSLYFFWRNLTLNRILKTPAALMPYSITMHDGKYYVGTWSNEILIVKNDIIIEIYSKICSFGIIRTIFFDQYNNCAITCESQKNISLYFANFTRSGYSLNTLLTTHSARLDSKGRFIVVGEKGIQIFN